MGSGESFAVARDGKGLENLVERLAPLDVALIVLEATGGFETTVAAALAGAGLPLAVVETRLQQAESDGLIERTPERIAPTRQGQRFLNRLLERFLGDA